MQAQETTLHLIPRNDENDFTRSITLKPSDDPVIIGRASKTASKGLVPLPENAWFNSPIMSREHGKLFLAPKGEVSKNSTFSVPNDDVESLSDDSDPGSCQILDSHPRTFSVPSSSDEMEDSDDEDVVIPTSRRVFFASVNAAGSQKSHSPPSNVHNSNSYQDSDDQDERTKSGSLAEAHALAEAQSFPSTQHECSPVIANTPENDSEDEGPDVIHWGKGQQSSGDRKTNDEDTAAASMFNTEIQIPETYQSPDPHASAMQSQSVQTDGHNWQATATSAENQEPNLYAECTQNLGAVKSSQSLMDSTSGSHVSFHKPTSASSSGRPTLSRFEPPVEHGQVSFSQSSDDQERSSSRQQDGSSHTDNSSNLSQSSASLYVPDDTLDTEETSPRAKSGKQYLPGYDAEQDNDKDTSQNLSQEASMAYPHRDAAREFFPVPPILSYSPPKSTAFGYNASQTTDYESPYLHWTDRHMNSRPLKPSSGSPKLEQPGTNTVLSQSHSATARPPSPSDAALPKVATLGPVKPHGFSTAAVSSDAIYGCHGVMSDYARSGPMATSSYNLPPAKFFGDLRSNPSMRAHRSSLASVLARASDDWQKQASGVDGPQPKLAEYHQGPFSRSSDSFHTPEDLSQADPRSTSPAPRKHCLVKLKLDNKTTDTRDEENSLKMSRVQISNLVNSQAEGSRGKKRKSNQMSTEESPSIANTRLNTRSAPAPAQAKPVLDLDTAAAAHKPMSQGIDRSNVKVIDLPSTDAGEEEPVRKKTKTSSSKGGTVGKVISGICLGVAGAFAAFVAATPVDVWEEALREAVKLK
ncbi:MAG: hypothetical protein Q9188_003315 [Gyalolechia gomerana]